MHDPAQNSVAVLTGNGVSIAFNPKLNLERIGSAVLERFRTSPHGPEVEELLHRIAARDQTGDPHRDFEVLVGAFGGQVQTFEHLRELAVLLERNQDMQRSLRNAADFAQSVSDIGTSHVLEIIADRSVASFDLKGNLTAFINGIIGAFPGSVTIGNLNYDSLLLAASMELPYGTVSDLADGRYMSELISPTGGTLLANPLRTQLDCPNRVCIYQLHGSLTYWRRPDGNIVKISAAAARRSDLWNAVREDSSFTARPVVVLANQRDKAEQVTAYPFAMAYEGFTHGLDRSNNWLIVGYSFRDGCVNQKLREAFRRKEIAGAPVQVLVVTYGDDPTPQTIAEAFGSDPSTTQDWLTISRSGADDMISSSEWQAFTSVTSTIRNRAA